MWSVVFCSVLFRESHGYFLGFMICCFCFVIVCLCVCFVFVVGVCVCLFFACVF